jgi:hypothetical protein
VARSEPGLGCGLVLRIDSLDALDAAKQFATDHQGSNPLIIVTLARIRPPRPRGADIYREDYQFARSLKDIATSAQPSSAYTTPARPKSEDFLESASGTNGLTGAADFVMVLQRRRTENNVLLKIPGRDVAEASYNLLFDDGLCSPNGTGLSEAAEQAQGPRLGPTMQSVLALVNSRTTTTAVDVSDLLGIEADTAGRYLRRLAEEYGLITRAGRGRYLPN